MMKIPNIIDPSVPLGKDDSENVEVQRFGEATVPSYEIPHHADIIERFNNLDKEVDRKKTEQSFFVDVKDLRENGYDLSINKYKEIVYEEVVYDEPLVIMSRVKELEREISVGLEELERMLEV